MQLKERDGIACDHCGTQYKKDFTYYSWDFRPVAVIQSYRPQLNQIFRTQITFSLDICTACFAKFSQEVITNYSKSMDQKDSCTICEFSGTKLTGTYNYYHIEVQKVQVRMTGQPNICVKCRHRTFDENKVCSKCQGTDFVKPADTNLDKRFAEFNISEEAYESLRKQAEKTRQVASQWLTSS
jgi:hypothetical protein